MASILRSRGKAQAELKFACLKLRRSLGGVRKLEDVRVEEWEASVKIAQKILDLLEKGEVDASVLRSYEVDDLVGKIRTKVAAFVSGLESVIDRVLEDDAGRFQIREKLDLAKSVVGNLEMVAKEAGNVSEGESLKRADWEEKNPRLAEQERELNIYEKTLRELLLRRESLNKLEKGDWVQAEGCLRSLELYLLEHKIDAQRIKDTQFEELLRELLGRFELLDEERVDGQNVDVDRAERVWGLVDKLGSGVAWLMRSERLWTAGEPKPTTRSVFLLKSAPPAKMSFSASKKDWQEKELDHFRDRIRNIILSDDEPITSEQEQRWSAAYRVLEALQLFLKKHKVEARSIQKTNIKGTMQDVEERLGLFHSERGEDAEAGVGDFALMYVTWECAMRLSKQFQEI